MKTRLLISILLLCAGPVLLRAEVPAIISYSGRISVSNTLFTGTGQFKFTLVNAGSNVTRQATATATISFGFVVNVAVVDGGNGYASAPTVTFSEGGGSGAAATAIVSNGVVTGFTVTANGTGYTSTPTVTVAPPLPSISYVTYWSHDGTSTAGSEPSSSVALPVVNGLFVVPLGDTTLSNMAGLPPTVLNNDHVRLRIWFNDGVHGFAMMPPDHPFNPAPYALVAQNLAGSISASQLPGNVALLSSNAVPFVGTVSAGQFVGNGGRLSNLNAGKITGSLPSSTLGNAWQIGGNASIGSANFLGTTDTNALEFRVNNQRGLRIAYGSNSVGEGVNFIGGFGGNSISNNVVGGTIAGGGRDGRENVIVADFATIGGGYNNTASGAHATIGGGYNNTASGDHATGGGGASNIASGRSATVGGGGLNAAGGEGATVSGGLENTASGVVATISGGENNTANATSATIGGGFYNTVSGTRATISGGYYNIASTSGATIGGGYYNTADGTNATVGGGSQNSANDSYSTVAGGYNNEASGDNASIGGGEGNEASDSHATVAGGEMNFSTGSHATVGGGRYNSANSSYATIGGGYDNSASGSYTTVAGGQQNSANAYAAVGGGYQNSAGLYASVGGGYQNSAGGLYATVAGGRTNETSGTYATIPGGYNAKASNYGQMAYASGRFAETGDAQTSVYVLRGTTTSTNETELFLDGSSQRMTLRTNSTCAFDILIVARTATYFSGFGIQSKTAAYQIRGVAMRNDDAVFGGDNTALDGTVIKDTFPVNDFILDPKMIVDATVEADNTHHALVIKVTGASDKTVRWVATVRTAEVTFPD